MKKLFEIIHLNRDPYSATQKKYMYIISFLVGILTSTFVFQPVFNMLLNFQKMHPIKIQIIFYLLEFLLIFIGLLLNSITKPMKSRLNSEDAEYIFNTYIFLVVVWLFIMSIYFQLGIQDVSFKFSENIISWHNVFLIGVVLLAVISFLIIVSLIGQITLAIVIYLINIFMNTNFSTKEIDVANEKFKINIWLSLPMIISIIALLK